MDPEQLRKVEALYEAALGVESARRPAFLAANCAGDESLRREVESLLLHDDSAGRFLEAPALEMLPDRARLAPGQHVSHYEIQEKLGEGGMGVVYKARDTRLGRSVALKFVKAQFSERFEREARAIAALNHPHIATLYEVGEHEGAPFLAMEFVEGRTLSDRIKEGPLEPEEAVAIALQIVHALGDAHRKGVIHRDIKSANIMVAADGQAKVTDFGLARIRGETLHTKAGALLGTVAYMSPEQARGEAVDARADIWSLGVVLYEMLGGQRPFRGDSEVSILYSILNLPPAPLRDVRPDLSPDLYRIVGRALQKDLRERYTSADDLAGDLRKHQESLVAVRRSVLSPRILLRAIRRPRVAVAAILCLVLLGGMAGTYLHRQSRIRWARTVLLPEISRLREQQRNCAAFRLVQQAEKYLPNNLELERFRQDSTYRASFQTSPPGADVYILDYIGVGDDPAWDHLGRTPLQAVVVPTGHLRYRISKSGFSTAEGSFGTDVTGGSTILSVQLDAVGSVPEGIVRIPSQDQLEEFWLDRYEVTNRRFKEFAARGGYGKREYWKPPFTRNGRSVTFQEAMTEFQDPTGHPGPATWEFGSFPMGRDDYPVNGVSWYEAAAYCEFAGKSLPTVHHWRRAAGIGGFATILQLSNFTEQGPAPVGSYLGLGPYGTYDTAGNVKEWCWNSSGSDRFILGGAWGEPQYLFNFPETRSPFDRSARNGFRCAKYMNPPSGQLVAPIEDPRLVGSQDAFFRFRDRRSDAPAAEPVFQVYKSMHAYDRKELGPLVEEKDDTSPYWRRERISFSAAYGNERVVAYLYLPKNAEPPFQTVIFFPGAHALSIRNSARLETWQFEFFIRSGRAVMHPIYKGTYERTMGGSWPEYKAHPNVYREMAVQWYKDLARSIDYLESRSEFDRERLAYQGISWGACEGPRLLALEPRLKVGVLFWGGAYATGEVPAETDPFHFAPRSLVPTLMVNGRYDFIFPLESSQLPLFDVLGTTKINKRHFVVEGGHAAFDMAVVREALAWLDRHLGPTKTR